VSLFDDLMAVGAPQPRPKPKRTSSLFDDLMAAAPAVAPTPAKHRRRRARAPAGSPAIPSWLKPLLDQAITAEARKADPRPSGVLVTLRHQVQHAVARQQRGGRLLREQSRAGRLATRLPQAEVWLQAHAAVVLMEARRRLPRQPTTPRSKGPNVRKLARPVRPGVVGVIKDGARELRDRPIAAEAFTGGGLFSIALLVEGVFTPQICEMDDNAIETLKLNLHEHAVSRNANTWDPTVPDRGLDLLCGGPPCQSFSGAQSLGTPGLGVASGENMYPRVLEWIADTQSRVVLMENSAEVATSAARNVRSSFTVELPGDTKGPTHDFFVAWSRNLDALGYDGIFWVLYAPDYGTPQNRTRAWVVAWPKGAPWGERLRTLPPPTHGHPTSKAVRDGHLLPWISAFDRLASGCCGGYGLVECLHLNNDQGACLTCIDGANFTPAPNQDGEQGRRAQTAKAIDSYAGMANATQSRLAKFPPIDLSPFSAFRKREPIEKLTARVKVTDWLSKAVVAHFGKDDKSAAVVPESILDDVYKLRDSARFSDRKRFASWVQRISCRESAKLQDVPQWWAFAWDKAKARSPAAQRKAVFRQIGNGIPVNMGRAAVRQVLSALGYPTPIPGTYAADQLAGLWPEDRVDPCVLFNAPYAYPGALYDTEIERRTDAQLLGQEPNLPIKPQLTPQQRRARPVLDLEAWQQRRQTRGQQQERRHYWEDRYGDGVESYLWRKLRGASLSSGEHPPGFDDWREFYQYVQGQDPSVINHLVHVYAKGTTGDPRKIRAGEQALGLSYSRPHGLPAWSTYR
jgi:site-specific DNA-cytosine methylase